MCNSNALNPSSLTALIASLAISFSDFSNSALSVMKDFLKRPPMSLTVGTPTIFPKRSYTAMSIAFFAG